MKTLWELGPLDARSVFAALPKGSEWAYQTVKTLLSRMVVKGAVAYDQVGNSYLYRAAVAREELTRQEVQNVFERVVGAAVSPSLQTPTPARNRRGFRRRRVRLRRRCGPRPAAA